MAIQQQFRCCRVLKRCLDTHDFPFAVLGVPLCEASGYFAIRHARMTKNSSRMHTKATNSTRSNRTSFKMARWSGLTYQRQQEILHRIVNKVALSDCSAFYHSSQNKIYDGGLAKETAIPRQALLPLARPKTHHHDPGSPTRRWLSAQQQDEVLIRRRALEAINYKVGFLKKLSNQWYLARLRKKLDAWFDEKDFIVGAKTTITHILQLTSAGKYGALKGLLADPVVGWMREYTSKPRMTDEERLALGIQEKDVLLTKLDLVNLELRGGNSLAWVHVVMFAVLKDINPPMLLELNIRFRRDYSTHHAVSQYVHDPNDPAPAAAPAAWVVDGISHFCLKRI